MDAVSGATVFGALFLFSLFAPMYVGNPTVIPSGANTADLVVLGLGSAAGVGALLALSGEAMWHLLWPYVPGTGIERIFPPRRPGFRARIAPQLGETWDATNRDWSVGARALIATQFLFYRDAEATLRDWVRRRNQRFSAALSAAAAIVIGVGVGLIAAPAPHWKPEQLLLDGLFVALAVISAVFAAGQRQEADHMEEFWLELRRIGRDRRPGAGAAAEPSTREEPQTEDADAS